MEFDEDIGVMICKRRGCLVAAALAAVLCVTGCASEGIDSRRRDGVFTVSNQKEPVVPAVESEISESQPAEVSEEQPESLTEGTDESQAEEQYEGQPESQEEVRTEGLTEEQAESQTEEQPEGQDEGQPENQTEGLDEGQPEEQTEGQEEAGTEGQSEEQTEGQEEGQTEGQEEGQAEGQEEAQDEGQPEEQTAGQEEGQTEDQPEGQTESQPEEQPESQPETPPEEQTESQGLVEVIGPSGVNVEELNQKDNSRLVAGYDANDRDERNRPRKAVNFQEIFGKYNAEFLHGEDQTIMLSFTVGIDNDTIGPILDMLAQRGIHAHFFVTGDYAKSNPDVIWRILGEGHVLGNHSYAHPQDGMNYLSVEEIVEDTMTMQNLIRDMYGCEMTEYAFPSGFFSERALATICQLGYHTVFYSFAYNDYAAAVEGDSKTALDRLLRELHPGAIYLLHGSSKMTAGILANFLDEAAARGYSFVY